MAGVGWPQLCGCPAVIQQNSDKTNHTNNRQNHHIPKSKVSHPELLPWQGNRHPTYRLLSYGYRLTSLAIVGSPRATIHTLILVFSMSDLVVIAVSALFAI
jgi:hypothetical protein